MQEIIVILLGLAALSFVGWRLYKIFFVKRKSTDSSFCSGCSGCSMMEEIQNQKTKCPN